LAAAAPTEPAVTAANVSSIAAKRLVAPIMD
jgi:hypothetical protein